MVLISIFSMDLQAAQTTFPPLSQHSSLHFTSRVFPHSRSFLSLLFFFQSSVFHSPVILFSFTHFPFLFFSSLSSSIQFSYSPHRLFFPSSLSFPRLSKLPFLFFLLFSVLRFLPFLSSPIHLHLSFSSSFSC